MRKGTLVGTESIFGPGSAKLDVGLETLKMWTDGVLKQDQGQNEENRLC